HQRKELCRFTTVGSVDDGKSTLIGRLLYDAHGLYEDQLRAVERASSQKSDAIDLSLVTDGLKAEREQGITIDVAYRYFSTERRKFIIADTPGHVQYTRNMATGASTADVAIILIDARHGVLSQSRRHAYIASLLGIPHLAVCVNKMDLRGYDRGVFDQICGVFSDFAKRLQFKDVTYIPISALRGDNIVHASDATPWYEGPTLLSHLETVPIALDRNLGDFRFPVQYVIRPNLDYRGFSGQISSGVVKPGDPILVLPSRKTTRVRAIDVFERELESAYAPMSVTIRLEDEVDVSRGDMLVHPENAATVGDRFEAMLVWMNERPLDTGKSYLLKQTTRVVRAEVEAIVAQTDVETLDEIPAQGLGLNDIGRVRVHCHRPIFFDPYGENRNTGAFILIDSLSNNTVAAGMISASATRSLRSAEVAGEKSQVSTTERRDRLGQSGVVVHLSRSAGPEVAYALERRLFDVGRVALVVERASLTDEVALEIARRAAAAGLVAILPSEATEAASASSATGAVAAIVAVTLTDSSRKPAAGAPAADHFDVAPSSGPEDAAEAIVRELETRGIFA
ncbi:MAG TPA: sulfate adenylyltransferase subunit CysN, partial [Polyangiaceae bacterium]|nr:sulfate adenylyltransferase subunit CysN [Polyangiaceae bacterium]